MSKPRVVLTDVDGTILNNDERYAKFSTRYGNGDVEAFHSMEECLKDPPYNNILRLLEDLAAWNKIFVLSARDERDRAVTEAWLDKHRVKVDRIILAPEDDLRSAHEFKVDVYKELKEEYDVWMMLEDCKTNADALRAEGLTVLLTKDRSY